MLDEFEMGMPAERIDTLFEEVQLFIIRLVLPFLITAVDEE
jgi:hypothetical protein